MADNLEDFDPFTPSPIVPLSQLGIQGNKDARVVQCEQRTGEWFASRAGCVTASKVDSIVSPTGQPRKTEGRQNYLHDLVVERITGAPTETYLSAAMERGNELEYEARRWYEIATGNKVVECGFVYGDETQRWGCSPDGLIAPDRLLEIKCPEARRHVRTLLENRVPAHNVMQVQFQLYTLGVASLDFESYWPGVDLRTGLWVVEPDDKLHAAFREFVPEFIEELDAAVDLVRGW